MSDASPVRAGSMLLGNGTQLQLVEVDEAGLPAAAYNDFEARGRFTGERLFLRNPQLYSAIVKLLARGLTYREIADTCSVSVNTVCGVCFREGVSIETLRERIGRLGLDVAHLTMECIRDLLADPEWRRSVTAKDLSIIHGIAFTNAQLALGGATARLGFEKADTTPPGHDDYLAFVKNITPAPTGLAAGNSPPNSAAAGAPGGPALDVPASDQKPAS